MITFNHNYDEGIDPWQQKYKNRQKYIKLPNDNVEHAKLRNIRTTKKKSHLNIT